MAVTQPPRPVSLGTTYSTIAAPDSASIGAIIRSALLFAPSLPNLRSAQIILFDLDLLFSGLARRPPTLPDLSP